MTRTFLTGAGSLALLILLADPGHAQSLRGSTASVNRIYNQAVAHNLHFYSTGNGIRRAGERGDFVQLRGNSNYDLAGVSYPYVLPATHTFVERLAAQYRSACGEKLAVTSAVRPTTMRLINSVDKSVHPTGMAVDLRKPRNGRCLSWLRNTLTALEASGAIEAVEERNPPHFHVAVFPRQYESYVRAMTGGTRLASSTTASPRPASGSTGATYQVRRGDSLWTIARRNNVSVDQLREANSLPSSRILAGQVLVIPTR
ncbi:MAG TPA: DUF5715 family protein [Longimicrobiaceae bacterium]|nr:DUF5715 family protein [Longimicrobiaceae bacterium]